MRYELKSIPFWPVLKVGFFVNLVMGLLVGILYAMFLIPFMAVLSNLPAFDSGEFDVSAAPLGLLMIILPLISAVSTAFFGTVGLALLVLVYNLTARLVGGVELNLQKVDMPMEAVTPGAPPGAQPQPQYYSPPPPPQAPPPPPPPPPARPEAPPRLTPDETERRPDDSGGNIT